MTTSSAPNITITVVANILVAIIAATPPMISALTTVATTLRSEKEKSLTERPKILEIVHHPVREKSWRKVKNYFLIRMLVLVVGVLFVAINSTLYFLNPDRYFTLSPYVSSFGTIPLFGDKKINLLVVINFFFLCFYFISSFQAYKRLGKYPKDAKCLLFKKATILVELDDGKEKILFRCQETLKILGAKIIGWNPPTKLLEAYEKKELPSRLEAYINNEKELELLLKNKLVSLLEGYTNNELSSIFGGLFTIFIIEQPQLDSQVNRIKLEIYFDSVLPIKSLRTKSFSINRFINFFVLR
jgi:hypothetical protein